MIRYAPAKINLGLKITGKRPDGYHNLVTLMQQIGLKDVLSFKIISLPDIQVQTRGADLAPKDNLVYLAAKKLKELKNYPGGVEIEVFKRIPLGAGLGGGSSNAASTLLGLNYLWDLKMTKASLWKLAEELGADVPFFLLGGTCLAGNKGEVLTPVFGMPFFGVVLARPAGLEVSTARVFHNTFYREHPFPDLDYSDLVEAIKNNNRDAVVSWLERQELNALEEAAQRLHPEIKSLKDEFLKLGVRPFMSGSGPTVFSLFESWKEACQVATALEKAGCQAWASWTESN